MIRLAFIAFLLSSRFLFAAESTSIEFPLVATSYINGKEVKVDIEKLNQRLKKAGLDGLPAQIVVKENPSPYWHLLMKRIEAARIFLENEGAKTKKSPTEIEFSIESKYFYEFPEMCYRGPLEGTEAIIRKMLGNFLTEENAILGVRSGKTKKYFSEAFKNDEAFEKYYKDNRPEEVDEWLSYKTTSSTLLIVSSLGSQGDETELYLTYVKPCKK